MAELSNVSGGGSVPRRGRLRRLWPVVLTAVVALGVAVVLASSLKGGNGSPRSSARPAALAPVAQVFVDATAQAGIDHLHQRPILDAKLAPIMPWVSSVGAAVAAGDFNRDGWVDLYVTDSDRGRPNRLYRNDGNGRFTDVAREAGVALVNDEQGASMHAVWGDFDNDGWADLYLVRWGRDLLFRNRGDGTFEDVTAKLFRQSDGKPGTEWQNGNGAVWLDFDRDGRLDLYVANYFQPHDLWNLTTTKIMHDSFETARNAGTNQLFHQQADGSFREVAKAAGVADVGWTLAAGTADVDNDGWPDLYAANDFGPDKLFRNRGDGTFEDISEAAIGIDTRKGMNIDFGDFDNDGWLDLYITNITTAEYLQEGNMLFHSNGIDADGKISFTDIALESGTFDGGWGWAAKFFDYDNDGDLDLISGNGFISSGAGNFWYDLANFTVQGADSSDAANWPPIGDRSFSGYEQVRFFVNDGLDSFTDRAREVGLGIDTDERGIAYLDYDNDGDLDLAIANQHQPFKLWENRGTPDRHWLLVQLAADGAAGNRDAVGARVTVLAGGRPQLRERDGGNGFASQSDPRLHFGLGEASRVERIEVRWPDGGLQAWEDLAADQIVTLEQDKSRYVAESAIDFASRPPRPKSTQTAAAAPSVDLEELGRQLGLMETELERGLNGYTGASLYRARAAAGGQHDRAIAFFQRLVDRDPRDPAYRLHLGSAYIDKIPSCGGLAAVVCKGRLAQQALNHFDVVLEVEPQSWVGRYCRGINHLHWPRALLHNDAAAADLAAAAAIQEKRGDVRPHYQRIYVAWGDALTKAGEADEARAAWRKGLALFPAASDLKARLAISDEKALLRFVEAERSLEKPIDSDLSFLDREL